MFDAFESSTGERIRYYRNKAGMTQKKLAAECGLSEPAIRNYELGNRIPSFETLGNIAAALRVSYFSLAEPDLGALVGVLHCLFRMEYAHGLKPVEIDGKVALIIDSVRHVPGDSYLQGMLELWLEARKKYDSGEWTQDQYESWESKYPEFKNDTSHDDLRFEEHASRTIEKRKHPRPKKNAK